MKYKVNRIHFVGKGGVATSREQCLPPGGRCDRPRVARAADDRCSLIGVGREA